MKTKVELLAENQADELNRKLLRFSNVDEKIKFLNQSSFDNDLRLLTRKKKKNLGTFFARRKKAKGVMSSQISMYRSSIGGSNMGKSRISQKSKQIQSQQQQQGDEEIDEQWIGDVDLANVTRSGEIRWMLDTKKPASIRNKLDIKLQGCSSLLGRSKSSSRFEKLISDSRNSITTATKLSKGTSKGIKDVNSGVEGEGFEYFRGINLKAKSKSPPIIISNRNSGRGRGRERKQHSLGEAALNLKKLCSERSRLPLKSKGPSRMICFKVNKKPKPQKLRPLRSKRGSSTYNLGRLEGSTSNFISKMKDYSSRDQESARKMPKRGYHHRHSKSDQLFG